MAYYTIKMHMVNKRIMLIRRTSIPVMRPICMSRKRQESRLIDSWDKNIQILN